MKGCLVVAVPVTTGLCLMGLGFAYDVFFAGIPFQDPTPQLRAQYAHDAAIARGLELAGVLTIGVGLVMAVVRRLRLARRLDSRES